MGGGLKADWKGFGDLVYIVPHRTIRLYKNTMGVPDEILALGSGTHNLPPYIHAYAILQDYQVLPRFGQCWSSGSLSSRQPTERLLVQIPLEPACWLHLLAEV